jgi:aminocarboxymuconate-semialdehyde decarboxylase
MTGSEKIGTQGSQVAVDTHAHLIPESVITELNRMPRVFPSIQARREGARSYRFRFGSDPPSSAPPPAMFDMDRRSEWLEANGLICQIVSPWTDLFGYSLPATEATDWCRFLNEAMLEATRGRADLVAMAAIPLQDSRAAVAEMQRVAEAGCCGVMIGTSAPGRELDDPLLGDVWACAADLEMPVFIHPIRPQGDTRSWTGVLANTVGRLRESLLALARLLIAGVPVSHPGLRLILAHGGAGPEALLARLSRQHAIAGEGKTDPATAFRALYFDSVVIEPELVARLVDMVGPDHVLLGSDYPFPWEPSPRTTVERAGLGPAVEAAVLGATARELFRLPAADLAKSRRLSTSVGGEI